MRITNSANCPVAECAVDLGPICKPWFRSSEFTWELKELSLGPQPIQGPFDSSNFPVGCKSACAANLDGNPGMSWTVLVDFQRFLMWWIEANSPNCCSGSFATPETCPSSNVQFYSFFSKYCNFESSDQRLIHWPCVKRGTALTRMHMPTMRVVILHCSLAILTWMRTTHWHSART